MLCTRDSPFFFLRTVQPLGQAWFAASSLVCSQHAAGIKEQFLELSLQSLSLEVSLAARTFLILDEHCLSDELVILVLEVPNPCLVGREAGAVWHAKETPWVWFSSLSEPCKQVPDTNNGL